MPGVTFSTSAKSRLTRYDLGRFSTESLFDRVARVVCEAGCLPRKELYESWEMARRVRRRFRGGRIVDVAGGHGLLAHVMLLLDDSSRRAIVVDPLSPPSAETLHQQITVAWPRLAGRVERAAVALEAFALAEGDLVVSCHACGSLTDRVIDCAVAAAARLAVLPCCHDVDASDAGHLTSQFTAAQYRGCRSESNFPADRPADEQSERRWRSELKRALGLKSWVDTALAIDLARARRLDERGYRIWTQTIPASITAKNRLLLAAPR